MKKQNDIWFIYYYLLTTYYKDKNIRYLFILIMKESMKISWNLINIVVYYFHLLSYQEVLYLFNWAELMEN
jgi:hypothetical protein